MKFRKKGEMGIGRKRIKKNNLEYSKWIIFGLIGIIILGLIGLYISGKKDVMESPVENENKYIIQDSVCGNGEIEAGEACDGTNVGGYSCSSLPGFKSGSLTCNSDCKRYDVSECVKGNTINAVSCNQQDVQNAINSASDGDTVNVPAGTCVWNNTVTSGGVILWNPKTYQSKNIVIKGAGIDQTIIQADTPTSSTTLLSFSCASAKPFRLTGFTFKGMKYRSGGEPAIVLDGNCSNWRIDHSKFDAVGTNGRGIVVQPSNTGVIDHCIFINTVHPVDAIGDCCKDDDLGYVSWSTPLSFGRSESVYVEDSIVNATVTLDGSIDCYNGGRYTFRKNLVTGDMATTGNHGFDSAWRSCMQVEVYNNTYLGTQGNQWALQSRGGTGIYFNNNLTTINGVTAVPGISVTYYRACPNNVTSAGHGRCDGTQYKYCSGRRYLECTADSECIVNSVDYGPCNVKFCSIHRDTKCVLDSECPNGETCSTYLDGNGTYGYPCRDQIGRGTNQQLEPVYEWNNFLNGKDINVTVYNNYGAACSIDPQPSTFVKEGRDYYNDMIKPGYVPYPYPHPLTILDEEINSQVVYNLSDRMINWSNAGVPGGIPSERTKCVTVECQALENAATNYKDGSTNAAPLIQSAVDSALINTFIYVPAGKWRLDSLIGIRYLKDNITLRGAGPRTVFDCRTNVCIYVASESDYQWNWPSTGNKIINGQTKGSKVITIDDTSAFNIGQIAQIVFDNNNDPNNLVISTGGYNKSRRKFVRIIAKNSSTLTIYPPLYSDYENKSAYVHVAQFQVDFVGIENLTIDGQNGGVTFGIQFQQTFGSWIKDVQIVNSSNYNLYIADSLNCQISHSYLGQLNHEGSNGAGLLMNTVSECLIEDNIIEESFPNIEVNHGSSGNVFAYNFVRNKNGLIGIDTNHAPHNNFNLYEGNIAHNLMSDGYFGGSSDDVVYRNWLTGEVSLWCISLKRFTRDYSIIGNLLGNTSRPYACDSYGQPNIGNGAWSGTAQASVGDYWEDWTPSSGTTIRGRLTSRIDEQHGIVTLSSGKLTSFQAPAAYWGSNPNPIYLYVTEVNGNLITVDTTVWGYTLPPLNTEFEIWPGSGGFQELDLDVEASTLKKGNWNANISGIPISESLNGEILPDSLYLLSKPTWFGSLNWPPFNPENPNLDYRAIPAGYRFVNGLDVIIPPAVLPVSPLGENSGRGVRGGGGRTNVIINNTNNSAKINSSYNNVNNNEHEDEDDKGKVDDIINTLGGGEKPLNKGIGWVIFSLILGVFVSGIVVLGIVIHRKIKRMRVLNQVMQMKGMGLK